jgi:predicted nucleotidyltransferase
MFSKDFFDFISLLNKHKVEYMIVGGYAVNAYGYNRFTGDLDIWIRISEKNADKMMKVVTEYPAPHGLFKREDFLVDQPLAGNFFGKPPLRIDILNNIDGVKFEDCYLNSVEKNFEGEKMKFIGFEDLIKTKKNANRPKDKLDLIYFRKFLKRAKKKK